MWSFSRLNLFYQCPFAYKQQYVWKGEGENNFFAEYGTHVHSILESYAKGKLQRQELADTYRLTYRDTVKHKAPPNKYKDLNYDYFYAGLNYLKNFKGFKYEVIAVEKEVRFTIGDVEVKGYIDLLLRDKDGNLIIVDHKSASLTKEKRKEYIRQLTLYGIGVYQEYGVWPVELHINAFRDDKYFVIPFDVSEALRVNKWVVDTVGMIQEEKNFYPRTDYYYCNFLCNFRRTCSFKGRCHNEYRARN